MIIESQGNYFEIRVVEAFIDIEDKFNSIFEELGEKKSKYILDSGYNF